MSERPVLGYWKIRGLVQPIRFLLSYVGQDFEDKYYECGPAPEFSRDCWLNEKFTLGLDFPNLPYYIDGDVKLTQSTAILRYLARKHGLCGKTDAEINRQELVLEEAVDVRRSLSTVSYSKDFASLKSNLLTQAVAKLKEVDKFLGSNTWLTGSNLSFVDFVWYELLDVLRLMDPTLLSDCNNLQQFVHRFEALPAIKQYLESECYISHPINNKMASFGNE